MSMTMLVDKKSDPRAGGPFVPKALTDGTANHAGGCTDGEVWLCSGQSNMEMPIKRKAGGRTVARSSLSRAERKTADSHPNG